MNIRIAKALTFYIVPRNLRHKVRDKIIAFDVSQYVMGIIYLVHILLSKKSRAYYYFIELNPFHMECLYSAYKYIPTHNKKSVVLATKENIRLRIFDNNTTIFCINPITVKILDKMHFFNNADLIFVGSYFVWNTQRTCEYYFMNFINCGRLLLSFDHAPNFHNATKSQYNNVHQIVLADFLSLRYNMPAVYPIIFPQSGANSDNNRFLSVGVIGDQNRRDMDLYLKWLHKNHSAFSYIVSAKIFPDWRPRLKEIENIHVYEKASFDKLFELCRNSVFMPFLIHNKSLGYYETAISGNLNLALAFQLIPIIDSRLAELYGFTNENAIIYHGKDGCEAALSTALCMTTDEIRAKRAGMKNMYKKLIQQSEQVVNNIIGEYIA